MKTNYQRANYDYWQSEYQTDYPDTPLVKLYHHILKHESNFKQSKKTLKMLDYGCSNGKNALFFHTLNFDVYGVDINKIAINKANDRIKDLGMKNHFLSIDLELPEDMGFLVEILI
jgi:2-polyprenyl-3-methyl-5-hydroxy-6-metoxy-1,4-benzoquinol methylase